MIKNDANTVQTDRELTLEELDAISGGATQTGVRFLNSQPRPGRLEFIS